MSATRLDRFLSHIRRNPAFGRSAGQYIQPRYILTALAMLSSLAAFASPASAHSGTGLVGGFISGFLHPLTGWDHLLAMVSVGLWGAVLGRPLIITLPVIFPVLMVVGAFLGMINVPLPPVEIGIALSVLVLGGVITAGYKAPVWLACLVVAIFALFHGYAHGKELPSAADPAGYSTGFVLSTGLLHVGGIVIGLLNGTEKGKWIVRGIGAAIAAAGCVFLAQAAAGA
ncbi:MULTISPECIES: HupE/UreJ family protein [Asticcacaulis]|uniref:HupE/UreJ family protein n=1 Tax=Asticcacaulis TaxID=76890 RepID=UPI001AE65013|nr:MULTISPECIES: HupE/UreJ family protein [Asticcacaulis]MBP2157464.1 urease accessory protein [Asticcacaulis solisilvae]MDR6798509.1 urease accessory protein [Asticcacaulis sp. BE141]